MVLTNKAYEWLFLPLLNELARSNRLGLETVTLEVQIQRRIEETSLCRHQAQLMEQHLEALNQRIDRTLPYACGH